MDKIKVDVSNDNITVSIPDIEILSNEIDESSIEVYVESRNIFNPISVNDYATSQLVKKKLLKLKPLKMCLLSQAATKTQDTIKKYLNAIPGIEGNYQIDVKFIESNSDKE